MQTDLSNVPAAIGDRLRALAAGDDFLGEREAGDSATERQEELLSQVGYQLVDHYVCKRIWLQGLAVCPLQANRAPRGGKETESLPGPDPSASSITASETRKSAPSVN